MTLDLIGQLAWTGFATATYYCLFAMAFALVLKVNRVWNFAQAGVMVCGYFALYVAFRKFELPLIVGLAFGFAVTTTASWGLERFGFRVLRERQAPILTYFIFTIVFSQLTIYLAELFFGTDPKTLFSGLISPVFLVGPIAVSHWDLKAILTTAILVGSLALFMRYSRYGRYMIAVADNPNLAELYGIDTRKAYAAATIIAGILLLAGMYLFGTKAALFPSTPLNQLLVFAVVATLLAGIGNVFAAGIAGIALSLLQAFSILVIESKWQALLAYALIFVAIVFFPRGVVLPERLSKLRRRSVTLHEERQTDANGDR